MITTPGYWQMTPGGIHVPPGVRSPIPPSPPEEWRKKIEREIEKDIQPLRCPGLAPVAWREYQELMPTGAILHRRVLRGPASTLRDALGFWRLDEASGTRADSSSNANGLADTNSTGQATGPSGLGTVNAASFNGGTQYLSASDISAYDLTALAGCSFSFWLYRAGSGTYRIPISKNTGTVATSDWSWEDDGTKYTWYFLNSIHAGGNKQYTVAPTNSTWENYIITFSGNQNTQGTLTIYKNGGSSQTAIGGYGCNHTATAITIGQWSGHKYDYPWSGRVAFFGFWGRVITSTEIAALQTTSPY